MALKKNRRKFTFFIVILGITCVIMALGATAVVLFVHNPLAEPMALVFGTPTAETAASTTAVAPAKAEKLATSTPAELPTDPVAQTSTPTQTSLPVASSSSQGVCGGRGNLLLLFVGTDFSGGVWPQGADAVRVVKLDFDHEKITVVAFPRDLWVKTAGLANQNISATRLGLSYFYMENATMGTEKHKVTTATTLIGQALYDNFGVAPQTYLTVQMKNLNEMVDAVGGVDIKIPEAFVSDYKISFPAGLQHLDGAQAREYIRTYNPGGDAARRERQNQFAKAMQENLLGAGLIARLPELFTQFNQSIVTDLTPETIGELTCLVKAVPEEQISFYEISGNLVTTRDTGEAVPVLDPKVDEIKARLREWLEK
jgi:LCP family protein required for cell wall assembly